MNATAEMPHDRGRRKSRRRMTPQALRLVHDVAGAVARATIDELEEIDQALLSAHFGIHGMRVPDRLIAQMLEISAREHRALLRIAIENAYGKLEQIGIYWIPKPDASRGGDR
jgi:hypothetical protein